MILPHLALQKLLTKAISRAYPNVKELAVVVTLSSKKQTGDYATPVAMKLAKLVGQPPLEIAQHLVAQIGAVPMLQSAEVAAPGFINFTLKPEWFAKQVNLILADKDFGRNDSGRDQKVLVEFISANPTGPMTLGNGRGAFAGDTLSNVLTMNGWRVAREYYINDIGNQVNILAESVIRRYFQSKGIPTEYPDYCYQGEYVTELAAKLKLDAMKLQDMMTIRDRIKGRVLETMIRDLQRIVEKKLHIEFDQWFRESSLYEKKLDVKTLEKLRSHDLIHDKDGATWFRTTAFGDDKDRVLIKNDGEKTYFLSDIALRFHRFAQRGVVKEILFLGADHHGYIGRLNAAMAALGYAKQLDVQIVQLVRLLKDGQEVKMSKRAGNYVTLEEVVDEVGLDVARWFFLMHSASTHMDFDVNAAKEQSDKNPVFYVQYAGARIHSILKKTKGLKTGPASSLTQPSEIALIKQVLEFPRLIADIGVTYETHRLPFYAHDLATAFHDFYTNCRVVEDDLVNPARLQLLQATLKTLQLTMAAMGVRLPDKM